MMLESNHCTCFDVRPPMLYPDCAHTICKPTILDDRYTSTNMHVARQLLPFEDVCSNTLRMTDYY